MIRRVIGDTSAIVAMMRRDDGYHKWAGNAFREIPKPLLVCEAVIAEVCFLVGGIPGGPSAIVDKIAEGFFKIDFDLGIEIERVAQLVAKYADVPMSLADACLVRMSELLDDSAVFTLDSDFLIYRKDRNRKIPVIMPS